MGFDWDYFIISLIVQDTVSASARVRRSVLWFGPLRFASPFVSFALWGWGQVRHLSNGYDMLLHRIAWIHTTPT